MNLYDGMEYVYTVYREKSFTAAARKLFISQPSLSASVRRVEESLGYPIFDRATKPVRLTVLGQKYIESVEKILHVEEEFRDYLNDLENLRAGRLVLGGSSLYCSWILPPMVASFLARYPQVRMELREENTGNLFTMVQKDEIDLILDNYPLNPEEYESYLYSPEYVLLAVPSRYEVNDRLKKYHLPMTYIRRGDYLEDYCLPVPLTEFADLPFVLLKPKNHTRSVSDQLLQVNHMHPHVLFETDQQMTAYNITCSGLGISFVSNTLVNSVPVNPGVVYYKLDMRYSSRSLYFYWKKGKYVTRAMREFLRMVHEANTELRS